MLENMVPSIDVTGGPWYNGNELDMEFINLLTQVAKKYIRDKVSKFSRMDDGD